MKTYRTVNLAFLLASASQFCTFSLWACEFSRDSNRGPYSGSPWRGIYQATPLLGITHTYTRPISFVIPLKNTR